MSRVRQRPAAAYLAFGVEVASVERISPTYVRIGLTGPDLLDFRDGGRLGPRDTRVKLLIPASQTLPAADIDLGDDDWYRRWLALDPQVRGHLRTYTVREWHSDGAVPQIDIDFVLHLDEQGRGGPASSWAARAAPGDRITVLGPHRRSDPLTGIAWCPPPATTQRPVRVLLGGDETAAPAIGSILRTLPDGYCGKAVIEVPCAADIQSLAAPPGVEVTWLVRSDRLRGSLLRDALNEAAAGVRAGAAPSAADLPDVDVDAGILWETPDTVVSRAEGRSQPAQQPQYAWIAGEAGVVRDIRRDLVVTHGVARADVAFMGYWREGRAEG